jgi:hypothetical protein
MNEVEWKEWQRERVSVVRKMIGLIDSSGGVGE